jgi:hypothetical protein
MIGFYAESYKIILEREQKFLDSELHLFNISSDASAPMTGRSHSNKTRKHFSNIRVGEGNPMFGKKRAKHVVEAMQENRWANGMKKKERVLRRINRKLRKEVIIEKDNKSIRCLSTAHASNIIGVASTTVADAIRSGRLKSKGWNIIVCNDKKYSEEFVLKHIELFDDISFYPKPELVEMLKNL